MVGRDEHLFDREFIRTLWNQNKEIIYKYALKDFHVEGLYSLMLLRSPELKIRLYVVKKGTKSLENTHLHIDTSLSVHNHPFDFQCKTLIGSMENLIYYQVNNNDNNPQKNPEYNENDILQHPENDNGKDWFRYDYIGALSNPQKQMLLKNETTVNIVGPKVQIVPQGEAYHFGSDQLHRIRVPSDQTTIMLFYEHSKIENFQSYIYSAVALPPETDYSQFYTKMSVDEVDDLLTFVLNLLQ